MDKGINFLEIGILYSVKEIVVMVMEIPSGIISDALGRRKILILSFFSYILSFIVFYFSNNYISIMVAMVLFAFADAFRTGVHKAMIFQYLKINKWSQYKIDYYGNTRSWSQTGSAISALIAAAIVYYTGDYSIIFIASALPYLADMILVYTYPKYLDGELTSISTHKIKVRFSIVSKAFLKTITNLKFISVLSNLSLYTGYYRIVKDYIQPILVSVSIGIPMLAYLADEKKIALTIGISYSIIFLLSAIASRNSGLFIKLFTNLGRPMNLTLALGFVAGISIGLTTLLGLYTLSIIGFLLIIVIENLRKPIGIGLVSDLSREESMATTLSFTSQAKSIFAAIIAPIIGCLADTYNPGIGIAIMSIFLLITLPIFWLRK